MGLVCADDPDGNPMTPNELDSLVCGSTYRVQIRHYDFGRQKHIPSRIVLREFRGIETRFDGTIRCAVFTSRVVRGRLCASEVSIPHYDLLRADPVHPGLTSACACRGGP